MRSARPGTATIEFALVFPVLLILSLVLTQTALIMAAYGYAQYGAFAAARTAIVVLPRNTAAQDPDGAVSNVWNARSDADAKRGRIRHAAAMALLPIAGRQPATPRGDRIARGAASAFAGRSGPTPAWTGTLLAERVAYALEHTRVALFRAKQDGSLERVGDGERVGPQDALTVRVEHDFRLAVPFVGALFADGTLDPEAGGRPYASLSAQATLTNAGIDSSLPPEPELPRRDP